MQRFSSKRFEVPLEHTWEASCNLLQCRLAMEPSGDTSLGAFSAEVPRRLPICHGDPFSTVEWDVGPKDSSLHEERTRATRTSSGCSVVECFDIGSDCEQVDQESSSSSLWETTPRTVTKSSQLQPTITEHFIISSDVEDAQAQEDLREQEATVKAPKRLDIAAVLKAGGENTWERIMERCVLDIFLLGVWWWWGDKHWAKSR